MEGTAFPLQVLASESIMICAEKGLHTPIEEFSPQGLLCDELWVGHAQTGSFTVPKIALNYAYRIAKLCEGNFFETQSPSCFLDLWISMLEAGVRADLWITVETEDVNGRRFEYEVMTALEIVQMLITRIWRGVWTVQALLNENSPSAHPPDSDVDFVGSVAAKYCRIDELSVLTCDTSQVMFSGPAGGGAADATAMEIDHVLTSGSESPLRPLWNQRSKRKATSQRQ